MNRLGQNQLKEQKGIGRKTSQTIRIDSFLHPLL
jgi:hypothetical protein